MAETDNRPKPVVVGEVNTKSPTLKVKEIEKLVDEIMDGTWRIKACLYGRSGTGKTLGVGTMPKKIGIIDVGEGLLSLAGEHGIKYVPILTRGQGGDIYVRAWEQVKEAMQLLVDDPEIKSLAIDDLTSLTDCALTYVLWSNGHLGQQPTQPEWGRQMGMIRDLFKMAFVRGKHFIGTAHQQFKEEQGSGRGWMFPSTTGKLAMEFPGLFDEVYHTDVKTGLKQNEFVWRTQADAIHSAKSRLSMLGLVTLPEEVVTIASVKVGDLNMIRIPDDWGFRRILGRIEAWKKLQR